MQFLVSALVLFGTIKELIIALTCNQRDWDRLRWPKNTSLEWNSGSRYREGRGGWKLTRANSPSLHFACTDPPTRIVPVLPSSLPIGKVTFIQISLLRLRFGGSVVRGNSRRHDRKTGKEEMKLEMAASLLLPSTQETRSSRRMAILSDFFYGDSSRDKIACQFLRQQVKQIIIK